MSFFDVIKDIDGKTFLALENKVHEEPNRIGSRFDDFEILQKLGV